VPPDRQQPLIDHLARAATVASEVDGCSRRACTAAHLTERGLIDANAAYRRAHPGLYEVVGTFDRTG
jgi:hypothetical protein